MDASADCDVTPVLGAEPQIFVSDIERACAFYVEKLRFTVAFVHGDPPFYAQVMRGGARLNLRLVHGRVFDAGFREREGDALSATLAVADAGVLFREFEGRETPFQQRLRQELWGAETFIVADPDGNLLCFAGHASDAGASPI